MSGKRYLTVSALATAAFLTGFAAQAGAGLPYAVADTGQDTCYDDMQVIVCPAKGQAFDGQDGQIVGNQPSYTLSGDGLTVHDNVTGLTWTQSPDLDGDGDIDVSDKLSFTEAKAYPATLNARSHGGFNDWRLPTIKELYSLIDFRGTDPPPEGQNTAGLTPFVDTRYFAFAYGDTAAGERIIDSQFWSGTECVTTTMFGDHTVFGVNLADGRIKGYGTTLRGTDKESFVYFVRGNPDYGVNSFTDNGDGAITDNATGLMWSADDSGEGMNWEDALAWVRARNNENHLGYNDWRLPNAKELQSIVDYTRSPETTDSAAIDPLFNATRITNMAGQADYPYYWTGTTHLRHNGSAANAVYVAFGRGMGAMNGTLVDAHGAGCQRSDPKDGDPGDYPMWGFGPQGDVRRVFNYVRLVRDAGIVAGAVTNAASFAEGAVAPGAIASLFGQSLSAETVAAAATPLPTALGGLTISITDSAGTTHDCPELLVSPLQCNFLIPEATATGQATLKLTRNGGEAATITVLLSQVAPGLFAMNGNGQGVGAILTLRESADGLRTNGEAFQYNNGTQQFVTKPIDLGNVSDKVYLLLFGTGIRGYNALPEITVTVGGEPVPVAGAADQGQYEGLDQVNAGPLPASLAGQGEVAVELTVDGVSANQVTVNIL